MKNFTTKQINTALSSIAVIGLAAFAFGIYQKSHSGHSDPYSQTCTVKADGTSYCTPATDHSTHTTTTHTMPPVTSERSFIEGMIPHHQEAVDAAREVLLRGGTTPAIRTLAEEILKAQTNEIELMKNWYQDWYGEAYVAPAQNPHPMMRDLRSLSGAELDRIFLADMIPHHKGALTMATEVQSLTTRPELLELTTSIKATQQAEISLMQQLLTSL